MCDCFQLANSLGHNEIVYFYSGCLDYYCSGAFLSFCLEFSKEAHVFLFGVFYIGRNGVV